VPNLVCCLTADRVEVKVVSIACLWKDQMGVGMVLKRMLSPLKAPVKRHSRATSDKSMTKACPPGRYAGFTQVSEKFVRQVPDDVELVAHYMLVELEKREEETKEEAADNLLLLATREWLGEAFACTVIYGVRSTDSAKAADIYGVCLQRLCDLPRDVRARVTQRTFRESKVWTLPQGTFPIDFGDVSYAHLLDIAPLPKENARKRLEYGSLLVEFCQTKQGSYKRSYKAPALV